MTTTLFESGLGDRPSGPILGLRSDRIGYSDRSFLDRIGSKHACYIHMNSAVRTEVEVLNEPITLLVKANFEGLRSGIGNIDRLESHILFVTSSVKIVQKWI